MDWIRWRLCEPYYTFELVKSLYLTLCIIIRVLTRRFSCVTGIGGMTRLLLGLRMLTVDPLLTCLFGRFVSLTTCDVAVRRLMRILIIRVVILSGRRFRSPERLAGRLSLAD